jgi:PadR family transcriptional regulator PadR
MLDKACLFVSEYRYNREKEKTMRLLSKPEELVLLSVWKLKQNAYCVPIRDFLNKITRKNWSFGSVYDPLNRLEKKGLLKSYKSGPTKERGGRSKRIYHLTSAGQEELREIKVFQQAVWNEVPDLTPETQEA